MTPLAGHTRMRRKLWQDDDGVDGAKWETVATDLAIGILFGSFKIGADLKVRAGFKTVSHSFLRTFLDHEPKALVRMLNTLDSTKLDSLIGTLTNKKEYKALYSLMSDAIELEATHVLSHLVKDGQLLAAGLGDSEMKNALSKGRTACLDLFLKAGYDVNSVFDDQTLLATAARLGLEDEAYLLLRNEASVFQGDRVTEELPLHFAMKKENESIALMLLAKGAPVTVPDKSRNTAMDYAIASHKPQLFRSSLNQLKAQDGELTYGQARQIILSGDMDKIKMMQTLFPSTFLVRHGLNMSIAAFEGLTSWLGLRVAS